jgi:hypothetical protein
MGWSVKAEWIDAYMRAQHESDPSHVVPSHNARTGEIEPPFSTLATEILGSVRHRTQASECKIDDFGAPLAPGSRACARGRDK